MEIGYYPGCSLHASGRELDESGRLVFQRLGIRLREIDDWSCCGATAAHATNHRLALGLAARNLHLADRQGMDEVLAPCAACFGRLASTRRLLAESAQAREEAEEVLGTGPLERLPRVLTSAELLHRVRERLIERMTGTLAGLRVACYYGCLLLRPRGIGVDDPETPSLLEDLTATTGAEPVAWSFRTECCGGGFSLPRASTVLRLVRAILEDALGAGARAIVTSCPMCQANLDMRQPEIGLRRELPVLYLTELLGLGLGLPGRALGLHRHFVTAEGIARRLRPAASGNDRDRTVPVGPDGPRKPSGRHAEV